MDSSDFRLRRTLRSKEEGDITIPDAWVDGSIRKVVRITISFRWDRRQGKSEGVLSL